MALSGSYSRVPAGSDGSQHNLMRLTFFEYLPDQGLACQQDVYPRDDLVGAAINLVIKSVVQYKQPCTRAREASPRPLMHADSRTAC
jgi:hypothetical protein